MKIKCKTERLDIRISKELKDKIKSNQKNISKYIINLIEKDLKEKQCQTK